MLSEEYPEMGIVGPESIGGTSLSLHLHVDDADAIIRRAVAAGAVIVREATNHFYGERSGTVRDPFGHEWHVGHEIEKVTPAEMQRRYDALMKVERRGSEVVVARSRHITFYNISFAVARGAAIA